MTRTRPRTRPRTLHQEPRAVTWAREKAGLTKRALAQEIGISEVLMGEIESGWRSATPANLARIARALNCPLVVLERARAAATAQHPATSDLPDPGAETMTAPTTAEQAQAPAGTWTLTTTNGYTATGHLPGWAEDDPSADGVPLDRLSAQLADITHRAPFDGLCVQAVHGAGPAEPNEILSGSIECVPYADHPEPNIPVVNLRIIDDHWITSLGPTQLADLATALRTHADHLDHHVAPALTAARDDWAARRGGKP
ncbi:MULTISPECIES: helix-turn-helix domain-containing protein [unclassified Streptomyces]|uniref:helix-turn-helix domain-containing protein n=1 Tax=unclassified Streptomyces TaxID=2593676 RepID=UPI002E29B636|nr:helix-turn-helix transcriptional regulator [Streptomyces sp. NBC_00223]